MRCCLFPCLVAGLFRLLPPGSDERHARLGGGRPSTRHADRERLLGAEHRLAQVSAATDQPEFHAKGQKLFSEACEGGEIAISLRIQRNSVERMF